MVFKNDINLVKHYHRLNNPNIIKEYLKQCFLGSQVIHSVGNAKVCIIKYT